VTPYGVIATERVNSKRKRVKLTLRETCEILKKNRYTVKKKTRPNCRIFVGFIRTRQITGISLQYAGISLQIPEYCREIPAYGREIPSFVGLVAKRRQFGLVFFYSVEA
jgi:hypothetical protein